MPAPSAGFPWVYANEMVTDAPQSVDPRQPRAAGRYAVSDLGVVSAVNDLQDLLPGMLDPEFRSGGETKWFEASY